MEFFQNIDKLVSSFTPLAIFLRLFIAMLLGTVIGIDRELKNRGAGIKTHALVCLGSAIVMIVSEYIFLSCPDAQADMNRMGAQVVSGVGFLGVGTIIVTGKNVVRGLTTAAGLWTCACAGLAAGIGYVWLAFLSLCFCIFVFTGLGWLENRLQRLSRHFSLYLELESSDGVHLLLAKMRLQHMRFHHLDITPSHVKQNGVLLSMSVELPSRKERQNLLNLLNNCPEIRYFEGV